MKLNRPPPSLRGTRHQGAYYTRYDAHGNAVVAKWPRARGKPKSPVTQEQVARWDRAIKWARQPEPEAWNLALGRSAKSSFYARDIIIMETFGTDLSWPGWGKYPNGAAGGEATITPGYLKAIDACFKKGAWRNGGLFSVLLNIWLPATPKLYYSTIEPIPLKTTTSKEGQNVPHGNRLWIAEAEGEYSPTAGAGTTQPSWEVADPVGEDKPLWWWVAEKSANQPIVHWSTAAYRLSRTGSKPKFGYHTAIIGLINVGTGLAPPPHDVAQLNADQDRILSCLRTQPGVQIVQDARLQIFPHCDAAQFDGVLSGSAAPDCYSFFDFWKTTVPASPTCVAPAPTRDTYYWYIVYTLNF